MKTVPLKNIYKYQLLIALLFIALLSACSGEYTPKPRGYFRIDFPAKSYHRVEMAIPYSFKVPDYSIAGPDLLNLDQPNWITVDIPTNKAQIHLSYKKIDGNLADYIEDSRTLAYKHTQKASSIEEQLFMNREHRVSGTLYLMKGNAASPLQFYLTDSTRHFLRGALYIREVPNYDSLRPVIDFLSKDVLELIESTTWKETK